MSDTKHDDKPLALLVPGLDGTGGLFYRQIEALAKNCRVIAWAYRPGGDCDLSDLAHDLGRATAGEAPHSILVFAESFGGLVALTYVLEYPERVKRLVLVNSFPYFRGRLRIRVARTLVGFLKLRLGRRVKDIVVDRVLLGEGIPAEDRLRYREVVRRVDLPAYRRRLQLIQETDVRPHLGKVTAATVLLAAGRDKLVPSVVEARFMATRMVNAQVHEFPEAGHALLLTPGFSLADYLEAPDVRLPTSDLRPQTSDCCGGQRSEVGGLVGEGFTAGISSRDTSR
jgi:pimeloyl-ACP methyl ester carboxylesterase